jgi:hypothetical protein
MKNKFTFFDNFKETADKLPDDLRLKFYDAMTDYVFKGVEPDDTIVSAFIMAIKPQLDIEDKRGGVREGAGRKSKEIKNNQKNQIDYFEKIENQNEIKINQKNQKENLIDFENEQKTKEKTPPHPQENKNKNIYNPLSLTTFVPPLPEKDDSGMLDIEELIAATPPKKRFVPPKLDDINAYIAEKGLIVNGQVFLDYFTAGNWKDSEGKPVKNWKQKLITWDERDRRKRTIDAARGLLKTGVASGTYGKDAPL